MINHVWEYLGVSCADRIVSICELRVVVRGFSVNKLQKSHLGGPSAMGITRRDALISSRYLRDSIVSLSNKGHHSDLLVDGQ